MTQKMFFWLHELYFLDFHLCLHYSLSPFLGCVTPGPPRMKPLKLSLNVDYSKAKTVFPIPVYTSLTSVKQKWVHSTHFLLHF